MTDEYQIDNVTWAEKDGNGNIVVDTDSVNTKSIGTNAKYAGEFDGDDLGERVRAAADDLNGSGGEIVIQQADDGTPITWSTDITIDPTNFATVGLTIRADASIEYTNDDIPITVDSGGDISAQTSGARFKIFGGTWRSVGSDPTCWLRLNDIYRAEIYPDSVRDFVNANSDCAAVQIRNVNKFSEANRLGGQFKNVDIGLDFQHTTETGTSNSDATDSFDDTYIDNLVVDQVNNRGIWFRGVHEGTKVIGPTFIMGADGAKAITLNSFEMEGATIVSFSAEDPGATFSNNAMFETGSSYDSSEAPMLINPEISNDTITTTVSRADSSDFVPYINSRDGELEMGNLGKSPITLSNQLTREGDLTQSFGLSPTTDGDLEDLPGSYDAGVLQRNQEELRLKINEIFSLLDEHGLTST